MSKISIKVGEVEATKTPEERRDEFAAVIEAYKVQNPAKYELKKSLLADKLAELEEAIKPKHKK
jgi:hypothetical protein